MNSSTGAAVTRQPELFRAVVSRVPMYNMPTHLQAANRGRRPLSLRVIPDGSYRMVGIAPEQVADGSDSAIRKVGLS